MFTYRRDCGVNRPKAPLWHSYVSFGRSCLQSVHPVRSYPGNNWSFVLESRTRRECEMSRLAWQLPVSLICCFTPSGLTQTPQGHTCITTRYRLMYPIVFGPEFCASLALSSLVVSPDGKINAGDSEVCHDKDVQQTTNGLRIGQLWRVKHKFCGT